MRRVLIVDDNHHELAALREALEPYRAEWDVSYSLSSEAAMASLRNSEIDAVLVDARMPDVDGHAILEEVQRHFEGVIRILLADAPDEAEMLRGVESAHQVLHKPWDASKIVSTVERVCRIQEKVESPAVRDIITGIGRLPSAPKTYLALTRAMQDPDVSFVELARIVQQDAAIAAKLLQLVNSAYFGLARPTAKLNEALSYIGLRPLRSLVLSFESTSGFAGSDARLAERFQRNGLRVGSAAMTVMAGTGLEHDAFTAGLMHDIGRLALATRRPDQWQRVVEEATYNDKSMAQAEFLTLGVTHAELGAALLGLWGLPYDVIEAVAYHHRPAEVDPTRLTLAGALHIADNIVWQVSGQAGESQVGHAGLDHGYLESSGLADRIPDWQTQIAQRISDAA